ncbi:hypothetical protein BS47DRAFT_1373275 [Hydnum rufescens UP504]|uniref:3-methyl-2-oxobutanoate hydroxymethyltransferase n=1 Tax=Hydnum rufescens UP504 TaxID=1448309 RepID=A0A9P6DUJ9_9AGAM|nr:hypothetical protein BS47DRAFT_1373275 [Hydnum rufescens UP504]
MYRYLAPPRSLIGAHLHERTARRWMSARPELQSRSRLLNMHEQGKAITMLTAYDYPTGLRSGTNGLAQVALGYDSTTRLTLDEMIHHTRAVARGAKSPFLVVDMPFGTYHTGTRDAIANAVRLVQQGGAEAVKLEGGNEILDIISSLSKIGIPTVGHIGLLPQRHTQSSGYHVQGKDARAAYSLLQNALALQSAGAILLVLEALPHPLATHITRSLSIPTIGIGAGPGTSGQVLVHDDMLGIWNGHRPKFVRVFSEAGRVADEGAASYVSAVRNRSFPDVASESYEMDIQEWEAFLELSATY